jgi:hypothetical protein
MVPLHSVLLAQAGPAASGYRVLGCLMLAATSLAVSGRLQREVLYYTSTLSLTGVLTAFGPGHVHRDNMLSCHADWTCH